MRYPVVYLLHGSQGTASSWDAFYPALDWMIEQKLIMPLIAVAPITGNSYWVDSGLFGAVESAVINELIPEIDRRYPTQAQRSGRALAGYSMGGFGSVYYAMRHPELFIGAVLLSPFVQDAEAPAGSRAATGGVFVGTAGQYDDGLWRASNYPGLLAEYTAKCLPVSMYIYVGDDDWNHLSAKEDLPEDAWRYNMEYQAVKLYLDLKRQNPLGIVFPKGGDATCNPLQLRVVNGGHNDIVWIQGFIEGLQYIERQGFGAEQQVGMSV
jgi:pimeloyl-ACP methyl ester carboxylesterase